MREDSLIVSDFINRLDGVYRLQRQKFQDLTGSLWRHLVVVLERNRSYQATLEYRRNQLANRMGVISSQNWERVNHLKELLSSLNPECILKRGYSVTLNAAGQVITSADTVPADEIITTKLAQGQLKSKTIKP